MLKAARALIPVIPKGKSFVIRLALLVFGNTFNGIITVKDGRKFYIEKISLVKRHLFFLNEYEDYETNIIRKIVKPGDYVLDVGASFGWFTTLMSKIVGPSGKVIAFELAPNVANECIRNVRLNGLEGNVIVESVALGDMEGEVKYVFSEEYGLGNLRSDGLGEVALKSGIGHITTLDHYVHKNEVPKIDFIKCDVDGAEVLFLKGARETISSQKPVIVIEASGAHGRSSCYEIFQELSAFGYTFFSLHHKAKLKPISPSEFNDRFKSNILCLPGEKQNILNIL